MASSLTRIASWRALALVGVVTLGVVTIVGSGGGSASGCLAPGPCAGDFPAEPTTPTVDRPRVTTQVGGAAVFSVHVDGITNAVFQWMRAPAGGIFVAISGATGASYTLNGATTLDDGATFEAQVTGGFDGRQVTLMSTSARLAVVSSPPILIQDGTFVPGDWTVAGISTPAVNGPSHSEQQSSTGGNPGDYRRMAFTMPPGVGELTLFHEYQGAAYDPASQGAIYLVDFTQDCLALPGTLGVGPQILMMQNGRRYAAGGPTLCGASTWSNTTLIPGTFAATDFGLIDGPACAAGEACPNFGADGLPIRFGFFDSHRGSAGFAGGVGAFGIDNWKVTIWRR